MFFPHSIHATPRICHENTEPPPTHPHGLNLQEEIGVELQVKFTLHYNLPDYQRTG